jgi:predicted ATPase
LINRVYLRNYKSIGAADIELRKFNFFVGRNGTGKSNVADAIALLAEVLSVPLQVALGARGGIESVMRHGPIRAHSRLFAPRVAEPLIIAAEMRMPASGRMRAAIGKYAFELQILGPGRGVRVIREQCVVRDENGSVDWFDRTVNEVRSSENIFNRERGVFVGEDALLMTVIQGFHGFARFSNQIRSNAVYSIDAGKLREFQTPDYGARLASDGANAASVLERLRQSDREGLFRLFELMSAIAPGTVRVSGMRTGRKQLLRFTQEWRGRRARFDAFNMSEGTLRAFGLLLAMFQANCPQTLIIEQPEDSLHPAATAVILEALKSSKKVQQSVITTHSPEVLDNFNPDEDFAYVFTVHEGDTVLRRLDEHILEGVRQHLCSGGDILRLNLDADNSSPGSEEADERWVFETLS